MRGLITFFILSAVISCSSGPVPGKFLQPEKMKKVVLELVSVDEFINNFVTKDSSVNIKKKRSILYEQVFKLNNTTRKEFYSSYNFYQQHPDLQKALYDSLYEDLNRKKVEPGKPDTSKPNPNILPHHL